MRTKIIKISPQKPEREKIIEAAKIIRGGGLVVFPTETVYGFGANALNKKAVARIFKIKKRDRGKPLLILIGQKSDLKILVKNISPLARKFIRQYWPGPLTLVFWKSGKVPALVTAGGEKIAVRLSSSLLVQKLCQEAELPLIGTSANLAGKGDIASAKKAIKQFRNKVDLIIDGGKTPSRFPSTVVDVTGKLPIVLRQGALKIKKLN